MKKYLLVLLLLSSLVLFAGCQNQSSNSSDEVPVSSISTETTEKQSSSAQIIEIIEIIDTTKQDHTMPLQTALEEFYSDSEYIYYYPCIKSRYVIVKYSDGSEETVENAINNGRISISDLDRFGIGYYKEKK